MLIIVPSKIKIDRVLALAIKGSWILTLFFCVFFAAFTVISYYQGSGSEESFRKKISVLSRPQALALEKIGQGPLSLRSIKQKTILPDMSQEVVVLAKNVRPDHKVKEMSFLLSLRSSKSELRIQNGEMVFLSCDSQPGGAPPVYRFTNRKTPLWIKPSFLDKNKVLIEVGLFTPSKDSEGFSEEKGQFILEEDAVGTGQRFQAESWFSSLQKAKLWGVDVVLSKCREKQYKGFGEKLKVEIPGSKGVSFCFMQQGDLLVWSGDKWVPTDDWRKANGKPLAQVKSASIREVEFEVWNEEGFYPQEVKLETKAMPKIGALKPDQMPQSVRARSSNQVSCCLSKQRYLLKPGDWILKTSRGWRVLKRASDIEEYLQHKVFGELCVFDEMVKEKGKLSMKGYWVDEMRTQICQFSVPVEGTRATHKPPRKEKKRFPSQPIEGTVTTYPPSPLEAKGAIDE